MRPKFKFIAFDLDGTLVDSMGDFTHVATRVISRHFGVSEEQAAQDYKRTSGLPFRYQLESLFPGDSRIAAAEAEYEQDKLDSYRVRDVFQDVLPALARLKNAGYLLGVSSNNQTQNVRDKVKAYENYFTDILGYEPGFFKGRDHFDFVKTKHGLSPDEILFVGDSLHDAQTAHTNGVPFVARLGTFSENDFLTLNVPLQRVSNLDELCQLLALD